MADRHVSEKNTGTFLNIKGSVSTPYYTLEKPVKVSASGFSFFIEYLSSGEVVLQISFISGNVSSFEIPFGKNTRFHYQIPILKGMIIKGFKIQNGSGKKNIFRLMDCGLEKSTPGFYSEILNGKEKITLYDGIKRINNFSFTFRPLVKAISPLFNQTQIILSYAFEGNATREAVLELSTKEKSIRHRFIIRPGGARLYFYSGEEGFCPENMKIIDAPPSFRIIALEIKPFSRLVSLDYKPTPADLGVILKYPYDSWRRNDFEIFSWSLFPDFLVMDFKDYSLQSRFLKRLAFFLEKKGYAGRLLKEKELAPLHGWNAHDYRSKDLALFFNKAVDEGFQLNSEEYTLRDILLKNGIIKEQNSHYIPVKGGFLAYSREASDRLRYLFITHEGYHGVFFSSPLYRKQVQLVWDALSPVEKKFWTEFLDWKKYNIKDQYLVVNEFQAYLMQQKLARVESYYKNYIIPKLIHSVPGDKREIDALLHAYPDHFIKSAEQVNAYVSRIKGITAGELRCVIK